MINLHLPAGGGLGQIGFTTCPLFEAMLSLHVLQQPNRHPLLLPWVRRCRRLSAELRAEIRRQSFTYGPWIPAIWQVGLGRPLTDFDESLQAMTELPHDRIITELTMDFARDAGLDREHDDFASPEARERVLAHVRRAAPDHLRMIERVYASPGAVVEELAAMLRRYWDEAFAEEWDRIEPLLQDEIDRAVQVLATRGVGAVFPGLLPEIRLTDAGRVLHLDKEARSGDVDISVADRGGLTLVPSVYAWPAVLVEIDPSWPLFITYPIAELQEQVGNLDRHEVVDTLRALADDTRLTILRLVGEQPRSTKELAGLLQLSEPAVSRHLKQLNDVGLLSRRREGYYVLYELQLDRVAAVGPSVGATLDIDLPPSPVLPTDGPERPVVVSGES